MGKKETANYRIVKDSGGVRYKFCCDLSGATVCTTELYPDIPDVLMKAWKEEGEKHFNKCHRCGRWVIDAMYNADVLECVECAPWEGEPAYCKTCGARVSDPGRICPVCGELLVYEGRPDML